MVKIKYNDFLLEQLVNMINESEVVFSNKFRKLLMNIDSPISDALKSAENKDFEVSSNYLDVADNKDSITFIPDRKAQEIIKGKPEKYASYSGDGSILTHNIKENGAIFQALGYEPEGEKGYKPEDGEKGLVVAKTISQTSGNAFLYMKFDNGKCVIREDRMIYEDFMKDVWTKNRQSVRIGRAVQALLNASGYNTYKASEIEDFVNKYKSAWEKMNDAFSNFEEVSGQKIGYWYNSKRYAERKGTLSNSCMASVPTNYFEIYMTSPNCQLLILKTDDGEKIKGRALLWTLKSPEGVIYLDRIYTHEDSDVQLFRDYAKSKGWYYKPRNDSSDTSEMISPDGTKVDMGPLIVSVRKGGYGSYPYVDTIKYYNSSRGTLSTSSRGDTICLDDTDGGGGDDECDYCGGSGEVECYECSGSGEVECNDCDGTGKVDCDTCSGAGEIDGKTCTNCDGDGQVDCDECSGRGEVSCPDCGGDGTTSCPECG